MCLSDCADRYGASLLGVLAADSGPPARESHTATAMHHILENGTRKNLSLLLFW